MKNIKHSKGPWESVTGIDMYGSSMIINQERDLDDPIAVIPNDNFHNEMNYDTELITQAPEMARILFELVKYEYESEKAHYIETAFNNSDQTKSHIYFKLEVARKILKSVGYDISL